MDAATPTRRQRLLQMTRKSRVASRASSRKEPAVTEPTLEKVQVIGGPVGNDEEPEPFVPASEVGEPEPFIQPRSVTPSPKPQPKPKSSGVEESKESMLTEANLSRLSSQEAPVLPPPIMEQTITPRVSNPKTMNSLAQMDEKKSDWSFSSSIADAYEKIKDYGACETGCLPDEVLPPGAVDTSGESEEANIDLEELKKEIRQPVTKTLSANAVPAVRAVPSMQSLDSMGKPAPKQIYNASDPSLPKPIAVPASPDRPAVIDDRAETPIMRVRQPTRGNEVAADKSLKWKQRKMREAEKKKASRKKKAAKSRQGANQIQCTPIDFFAGCGKLQDALFEAIDQDPNHSMMADDESSASESYLSDEDSQSEEDESLTDSTNGGKIPSAFSSPDRSISKGITSRTKGKPPPAVRPSSRLAIDLTPSRPITRTESVDHSVWDAKLDAESPAFVKAYIAGLHRKGLPLLLHKKRRAEGMNHAMKVKMFLRFGRENRLGNYTMPYLEWVDEDEGTIGAVGLFDVRTLEKASAIQLERYPLAMPGRSLFIRMNHASDIVLEARNEDSALQFIHGMRWVIARLSFNLIIGNLGSSCELLDVKAGYGDVMDDDDRSFPATAFEEERWNRAMNDVSNQMVDTTLTTMAIM